MRLPARMPTTLAALVAGALMSAGAASAGAQIAYAPCGDSNHFACGHLTVALDPSGGVPGTITLALRRHRAPVGEARTAIVALAGGPGQPAVSLSEEFAEVLGPVASTRDLIVFDQRGVGLSHPLACHAFERPDLFRSIGPAVAACGAQLGPTRTLYSTPQTVADIEAIRQAGGYEKLVLYGTSYGTKVAEEYAQAHPDRVEALVLDSVVTPTGPDPLDRSTFAAIPRVLRQICAAHACAGITAHPVADLARLDARIHRAPLRGTAIDGEGRRHTVAVSSDELFALLLAGDFSPALRAEFVTTVRAAAARDTAPLARLLATAAGGGGGEREDFDTPLYYATICEEQQFPWSRAATPAKRLAEARAALDALPAAAFAPFPAATALDLSDIPACAGWPFTAPAPPPAVAPLPGVPALILSGTADLRTPTADARALVAQLPGSNLLVVPYTGHSVLGNEPTSCASDALRALFAARPVKPCSSRRPPGVTPPPLPPLRLDLVSPARGYRGRPGRTLHAVALSLGDLFRQLLLQLGAGSPQGAFSSAELRTGGLRAGWARASGGQILLRGYSYVPGVAVSGTLSAGTGKLTISGSSAAHGTLGVSAQGTLSGTLEGVHVRLAPDSHATAAIVGSDAQTSYTFGIDGPARRRLARELGRLLPGRARH